MKPQAYPWRVVLQLQEARLGKGSDSLHGFHRDPFIKNIVVDDEERLDTLVIDNQWVVDAIAQGQLDILVIGGVELVRQKIARLFKLALGHLRSRMGRGSLYRLRVFWCLDQPAQTLAVSYDLPVVAHEMSTSSAASRRKSRSRAKSSPLQLVWYCLRGGASQLESFLHRVDAIETLLREELTEESTSTRVGKVAADVFVLLEDRGEALQLEAVLAQQKAEMGISVRACGDSQLLHIENSQLRNVLPREVWNVLNSSRHHERHRLVRWGDLS